jgi:hypothetical protein
MPKYAIERDNKLVRQVVFLGKGLYRQRDVVTLLFDNIKKAEEVSIILNGKVVEYKQDIK